MFPGTKKPSPGQHRDRHLMRDTQAAAAGDRSRLPAMESCPPAQRPESGGAPVPWPVVLRGVPPPSLPCSSAGRPGWHMDLYKRKMARLPCRI